MKAIINKILDVSFVDGDGNRTVIFFQGCNLNCMYCHNPETICCKNYDETVKNMSVDEVFDVITKNKDFIRGVTCSGGECTMQNEFITELFKRVKAIGLSCLIDTNGAFIDFENYHELVELCDGFMLDIKASDDDICKKLTGRGSALVLKNAEFLAGVNKLYEIRTVVTKNLLDNKQTIDQIGEILKPFNINFRYKLIKFRHYGVRQEFQNLGTPTDEYMLDLKDYAKKHNFNIILT